MTQIDDIAGEIVDAPYKLHTRLGPGLLESVCLPVGLLISFGAATLKEGLHGVINGYNPSAPPRLRVNQGVMQP